MCELDKCLALIGEWTQIRTENLDGYLAAAGRNWVQRKIARSLVLTQRISLQPNSGNIKIVNGGLPRAIPPMEAVLGMPTHMENPEDGTPITVSFSVDGVALVSRARADGKPELEIRREVTCKGEMKMTQTFAGASCSRYFERVGEPPIVATSAATAATPAIAAIPFAGTRATDAPEASLVQTTLPPERRKHRVFFCCYRHRRHGNDDAVPSAAIESATTTARDDVFKTVPPKHTNQAASIAAAHQIPPQTQTIETTEAPQLTSYCGIPCGAVC